MENKEKLDGKQKVVKTKSKKPNKTQEENVKLKKENR